MGSYSDYYFNTVGERPFIASDVSFLESKKTLDLIRDKCGKVLQGVHPEGKYIYVSDDTIKGVVSGLYYDDPATLNTIVDRAIHLITSTIKDEFTTIKQNNDLSVWVTQYGSNDSANKWGLRSHPKLKMKERRPAPMIFNMRY